MSDGDQPVCELGSTGSVAAVNTFGAIGLASRHTSSGDVTYTYDPFGNISQVLTNDTEDYPALLGDISDGYSYQDWQSVCQCKVSADTRRLQFRQVECVQRLRSVRIHPDTDRTAFLKCLRQL